ncbi:unnamed protein product [Phytophthora fragariaefolia]|uniref:Unnamed protein product n=1 Tax=Phytophthora fragariaefolia TaxID=1490495 RepID=A0A9W7CW12_9STRA|nr:unnamed protein product [Phytophthora fragariaefolia]
MEPIIFTGRQYEQRDTYAMCSLQQIGQFFDWWQWTLNLTSAMRAAFVFVLLLATILACFNGITSAESAVTVSAAETDAIQALVDTGVTGRKLRGAVDEERVLTGFADKVMGLFRKNPALTQQVDKLQKNPSMVKSLEKATLSQSSASKLRAYYSKLLADTPKAEKFFIYSTLLLFAAGMIVTWS